MKRPRKPPLAARETAEIVALKALAFIGSDERVLAELLAQTGMGPEDLRAGMGDPEFLAGVLDYLLGHEPLLVRFCEETDLPCDLPLKARRALPGGEAYDI